MDNTFSLTQLLNEIVSDIDESNKKKGKKNKDSADTDLEKMAEKKMKETPVEESSNALTPEQIADLAAQQGENIDPALLAPGREPSFIDKAKQSLGDVSDSIAKTYRGVTGNQTLADRAGNALDSVKDFAGKAYDTAGSAVNDVADSMKVSPAGHAIRGLLGKETLADHMYSADQKIRDTADRAIDGGKHLYRQATGTETIGDKIADNPWMIGVPAALAAGAGALALRKKLRDAKNA